MLSRSVGLGAVAACVLGCASSVMSNPGGRPVSLEAACAEACAPAMAANRIETHHDCYRALSEITARLTCEAFNPYLASLPSVDLHGDPHVEQIGRIRGQVALLDFDDAARGPFIVDLVRALSSLAIARHIVGEDGPFEPLAEQFFEMYRAVLRGNDRPVALPFFDRTTTQTSSSALFRSVEGLMTPFDSEAQDERATTGHRRYVQMMRWLRPALPESMYTVKRTGALTGNGIGSLRSKRVLAVIEGPTSSPEDDVVLEAKQVRFWTDVPCVRRDVVGIPTRARIFEVPEDPWAALVPRDTSLSADEPLWWIQSWSRDYREFRLGREIKTRADLEVAAEFLARALGRAHSGAPLFRDPHRAFHLLSSVDDHEQRILELVGRIERMVLGAPLGFR